MALHHVAVVNRFLLTGGEHQVQIIFWTGQLPLLQLHQDHGAQVDFPV